LLNIDAVNVDAFDTTMRGAGEELEEVGEVTGGG
jgi:hypothetical protein